MNRAQHSLATKWEQLDRTSEEAALRALINSPDGRKLLWKLLTIGKVGVQPFTANALNTSFNCGELNVGQQILALILEVDPAGYVRMMQEQANERKQRDEQLAAAGNVDRE